MPVVSSQYWNRVHGFTPDDVRQDLEGMQTMRTLANNMAWLLKCIALGKKQGIEMPDTEEKVLTNFIRYYNSSLSCCVQITKRSSFHDYGKTMIFFISSSNRLATGVNFLFVVYL